MAGGAAVSLSQVQRIEMKKQPRAKNQCFISLSVEDELPHSAGFVQMLDVG